MAFGDDYYEGKELGVADWAKKAIWENVPIRHRNLDTEDHLRGLLKVFQDELDELRQKITDIPLMRDPYEVRGREGESESFYVTSNSVEDNETYGRIIKLVGATSGFPGGYTAIEKIGPSWTMQYGDVTYTVVHVITRNYPDSANEVWVTGAREAIDDSVFPLEFMFYPPSMIDFLASDFGIDNDLNDPEEIQRSSIANRVKYLGLKASQDSYRIRGEISGFDTRAISLFLVCDQSLWSSLPAKKTFVDPNDSNRLYTEIEPRKVRFDDISADVRYYDEDLSTPAYVPLVDNELMYEDESPDRMSTGLAFAIDVTQAGVEVLSSTALNQTELDTYGLVSGYRITISISPTEYEVFNFSKGIFGITSGYPANLSDTVYWIDAEESYVSGTQIWTVIMGGVTSIVDDEDFPGLGSTNSSLRYWPELVLDCCYCKSHRINLFITPTAEAMQSYGSGLGMARTIDRLIKKIDDVLVPVHVDVMEYIYNTDISINLSIDVDIESTFEIIHDLNNVELGSSISYIFSGSNFLNVSEVRLTVQIQGDLNEAGETMDCIINNGIDAPTTLYSGQTGYDDVFYRTVVDDVDITSIVSGRSVVTITGTATATVGNGSQRWTFDITKE